MNTFKKGKGEEVSGRAAAHPKNEITQRSVAERVTQLMVSNSGTYKASGSALKKIQDLDKKIPEAESEAVDDVSGKVKGMNTKHQVNYMHKPSPKGWGYCVEEKLNPKARSMGWSTQHIMSNSRPDYAIINNKNALFADLTTSKEAGPMGNHITGKLNKSKKDIQNMNVMAADIVHRGLHPLSTGASKIPPKVNGKVTSMQKKRFQVYDDYWHNPGSYDQGLENVKMKFGRVSLGRYTIDWDQKGRANFGRFMQKNGH